MADTYYDSQLSAAEIEAVLEAIDDVISPSNNGKVLAIDDSGNIVARSVTWGNEPTLITKAITQNGIYSSEDDNADGYSQVVVNVSGGGGVSDWNEQFAVNWDFANAVNTRGQTTYNAGGAYSQVFTIDGWHIYGGVVNLVTGGLKLSRYNSANNAYFMQRFKSAWTSAFVGKTVTLSGLVNGVLGFASFTFPAANSGSAGNRINNVPFRIWNYGSEAAVTIDVYNENTDLVIQACKLELGTEQTLATQVNGVWILNHTMNAAEESLKVAAQMVTNS